MSKQNKIAMHWIIFLMGMLFSIDFLHAQTIHSGEAKKYKLSICALFKNEAKFFKEWIEYHRLIGVDHFYLYNNMSTDSYREVLHPYIKKGVVTLIQWPDNVGQQTEENAFIWSLGTQAPAYENAIKVIAGKDTKWLVFLDVDEFLVPTGSLKEVLEKYERFPGISLTSEFFDASSLNGQFRKKLLIESVVLTKPPEQNVQRTFAKMIFKPNLCDGFIWPPYQCVFKDCQELVAAKSSEIRINHYVNRKRRDFFLGKAKHKSHVDNRTLSDGEKQEILERGYEMEDKERVIFRFIPEMLKRMGYENEW